MRTETRAVAKNEAEKECHFKQQGKNISKGRISIVRFIDLNTSMLRCRNNKKKKI